jgi:predicted outer membrane repeat protein
VAVTCAEGCVAGSCIGDPCLGVECYWPPASYCADSDTLMHWDGTAVCAEGWCEYGVVGTTCSEGCSDGQCNEDPCAGVFCLDPPGSYCLDDEILITYADGLCFDGVCSYEQEPVDCPCEAGVCLACEGNFDPEADCLECLPNWDLSSDCTTCEGNWDLFDECATCLNSYGDVEGDDCGTCVVFVDGAMADDSGTGASWIQAKKTVQAGVDQAVTLLAGCGDHVEVWVAGGTYDIYSASAADTLLLADNVDAYGGFTPGDVSREDRDWQVNFTTLDGGGQVYHVVTGAGDAIIDGFEIINGSGGDAEPEDCQGNGMYIPDSSTPTVRNCEFVGNLGTYYGCSGGALYAGANSVVTVEGCSFAENYAEFGGAIFANTGATLVLDDCSFDDNSSMTSGGAVDGTGAELTITGCTFHLNSTTSDGTGGALAADNSTLTIAGSTFTDNHGGQYNGGAISILANTAADITDTTFSGNHINWTAARGGALYIYQGSITADGCTFSQNYAQGMDAYGGVLYASQIVSGSFTNCVFHGNYADAADGGYGGALYFSSGNGSTFTNCTFAQNYLVGSWATEGGAIYVTEDGFDATNTIFWGNIPDQVFHSPGSSTLDYCAVQGGCPTDSTCTGLVVGDPLFADGVGGDLHLLSGSAAIDAADGDAAPALDIEGNPRFDDPLVADTGIGAITYTDIGAYEYQGP